MTGASDHQMIMHANAQRLGGGDNFARHGNVGLGRRGIAGWMVVHHPTASNIYLIFLKFFDGTLKVVPGLGSGA